MLDLFLSNLGFGEKKTHVRFCSNELACRNVTTSE
jgi:hypothetical protein